MTRRPFVAGNWKMNGTKESVVRLLHELKHGCERVEVAELAILVPYVFLAEVEETLLRTQIAWGAQNVSSEKAGAFTGEISAQMLRSFNCTYVLVGHSERRQWYGETNDIVVKKFFAALHAGLRPILCVGETENQRNTGKTLQMIHEQLAAVLDFTDNLSLLNQAVIAYEPIWAIGTGKQATPEQAQEVHAAIRAQLQNANPSLAAQMRVLYGGSMKPDNAESLLIMPDVDGGLIGGASLQADQFLQIGMKCNHSF
ncbi:MAG: triose-phosphate isomerase [Coxiella sp. RIFCSPHIGHO2_12_FULL_42_15]|nr:MAG: triose-phosphate isomerase [Coxiella sp. RIFCSPHIGHO2_12_FULL_42_15]